MQFVTNSEFDKTLTITFERAPPASGRRFYSIERRGDGGVDVYLFPFDGVALVLRGVDPWDGMEDDIRARYYAWCESAEVFV